MRRDESFTLSEEGCDGSETVSEVPTWQDLLWVGFIQDFLEEIEDDLRVSFHYEFVEVVL